MQRCPTALVSAFLVMTSGLSAQVVVNSSVMGNGATTAAGGGLVSLGTIGQSVIGPTDGPAFDAWQGFWYTALPESQTDVREIYTAGSSEQGVALHQNIPNPFSSWTEVQIDLPHSGPVTLKVYNAVGREVRTLIDGEREAGTIAVRMDATDLESGRYTARLIADGASRTITMIVVR